MKPLEELYGVRFLPEEADIRVAGASYFLMRREAYCELTGELRNVLGRGAEAILFQSGYRRAEEFYRTTMEFTRSTESEKAIDAARFLSKHLGLYRVAAFTAKAPRRSSARGRIASEPPGASLLVERSFEVCDQHPSTVPRCDYIRGFWTGLVERMSPEGRRFLGTEVECAAMGYRHCRFEFTELPVF